MRRGITHKPSGQWSELNLSMWRQNQQRCAAFGTVALVVNVSRLADTCTQIRKLCEENAFKKTEHKTVMEYLEKRADRFRRNRGIYGKEIKEIIAKLKRGEEPSGARVNEENVQIAEHSEVQEALSEGQLQLHGLRLLNIVPTKASILYHPEEGPNMPQQIILATHIEGTPARASTRQ
jgi:hypothetical protein